jgi:hypothetical protein
MASLARRVAVPAHVATARSADAAGGGTHAKEHGSYASAFALPLTSADQQHPAEWWARAVFEGAPTVLRAVIVVGWRLFLGLRLEPPDAPAQVLGWRIESDTESDTENHIAQGGSITLSASSPLLRAENMVAVDETVVLWITVVHFERRLGQVLWTVASALHHMVIPFLLGRAAGSGAGEPTAPGVA